MITECKCAACQLQMRGEFQPGQFSTLSEDQLTFIRVFLRARGNLSEMEKVLGISYPTIRNKLDEVNRALDRGMPSSGSDQSRPTTPPAATPIEEARRAILQKVAAGEIPAADAAQKLRNLQGGQ